VRNLRCLHARVITCFHCDHSRHALFPLQASAPSTALESELRRERDELRRERDELRREREVLHVPRFILIPAIGHILSFNQSFTAPFELKDLLCTVAKLFGLEEVGSPSLGQVRFSLCMHLSVFI